jgi:hypothetical protein
MHLALKHWSDDAIVGYAGLCVHADIHPRRKAKRSLQTAHLKDEDNMHVLVSTINTARWGVRLRKSLLGRSYEIRKTPPADVMDAARQGIARSTKRSG